MYRLKEYSFSSFSWKPSGKIAFFIHDQFTISYKERNLHCISQKKGSVLHINSSDVKY
jgi:hypothetical protein